MIGHTKGQTQLPLPVLFDDDGLQKSGKDRVHILEDSVITWSRQIKKALATDPDAAFKVKGKKHSPELWWRDICLEWIIASWTIDGSAVLDWTRWEFEFYLRTSVESSDHKSTLFSGGRDLKVKCLQVTSFLKEVKSTYSNSFERLLNDLRNARAEADEISKLLKPVVRFFEKLNLMDEFSALASLFRPIFHAILFIWQHSKYYGTRRVVTLIREICNDLIMQVGQKDPSRLRSYMCKKACKFLPGEELIQMEAQEALDKLKIVVKVIHQFKKVYFSYKEKSKENNPERPWKFLNRALFDRLDSFHERCEQMIDLETTCLQVCLGIYWASMSASFVVW